MNANYKHSLHKYAVQSTKWKFDKDLNDHYPPFCVFQQLNNKPWVKHLLENIVWEMKKNWTLGFFQQFMLELVQYLKY